MKSSKICVATNQVSSLSAYWRNIFVACTFCMSHLSKYFIYNEKIYMHKPQKKNKIGQQHYISKSIILINFKLFSTSKFLYEILMEI